MYLDCETFYQSVTVTKVPLLESSVLMCFESFTTVCWRSWTKQPPHKAPIDSIHSPPKAGLFFAPMPFVLPYLNNKAFL